MFFVFSVKIMTKFFVCVKNVSVNFVLYFQSFLNGNWFQINVFFLNIYYVVIMCSLASFITFSTFRF